MTIPLPPECPPAAERCTHLADACAEADRWHALFHLAIKQRDELLTHIREVAQNDPTRVHGDPCPLRDEEG